jgi:GT2 family glycosyltransferase
LPPPKLITIAVPSLNQGRYLADALTSIFEQRLPVEVFVADGGSSDESLEIISEFAPQLAGWRSHPDAGQAPAINECIHKGRAPYVCWLNSDDMLLPGGLGALLRVLEADPSLSAVYGRAWNQIEGTQGQSPVWVEPFSVRRLAKRCIISQPATLIRRSAWEAVGGLDETLRFAMDYDLWWRLYRNSGELRFVDQFAAITRDHAKTKSRNNRFEHYREGVAVVRRHRGAEPLWAKLVPLPLRWRLARLKHWLRRR